MFLSPNEEWEPTDQEDPNDDPNRRSSAEAGSYLCTYFCSMYSTVELRDTEKLAVSSKEVYCSKVFTVVGLWTIVQIFRFTTYICQSSTVATSSSQLPGLPLPVDPLLVVRLCLLLLLLLVAAHAVRRKDPGRYGALRVRHHHDRLPPPVAALLHHLFLFFQPGGLQQTLEAIQLLLVAVLVLVVTGMMVPVLHEVVVSHLLNFFPEMRNMNVYYILRTRNTQGMYSYYVLLQACSTHNFFIPLGRHLLLLFQ